ncbi:hypothetical protein ACFV0Y_36290 [Streptomyces sp. NPDC059569]
MALRTAGELVAGELAAGEGTAGEGTVGEMDTVLDAVRGVL